MTMNKLAFIVCAAALLNACSSAPKVTSITSQYQAQTEARLRLYGQNGNPTVINYTYQGKKTQINVGGSLGDAFSSFIGTKNSESIGMPSTEITDKLGSKNGILSRAFFREVVVPANTLINIEAAVIPLTNIENNPRTGIRTITSSTGCNSEYNFTPKSGLDYEVTSNGCTVVIYQIYKSLAGIELIPVTQ